MALNSVTVRSWISFKYFYNNISFSEIILDVPVKLKTACWMLIFRWWLFYSQIRVFSVKNSRIIYSAKSILCKPKFRKFEGRNQRVIRIKEDWQGVILLSSTGHWTTQSVWAERLGSTTIFQDRNIVVLAWFSAMEKTSLNGQLHEIFKLWFFHKLVVHSPLIHTLK